MMRQNWTALQKWYDERTQREQIMLLVVLWVFVYLLFKVLFLRPVINEQKKIAADIRLKQAELRTVQDQSKQILTALNGNDYLKQLAKQKQVTQETKNLKRGMPTTHITSQNLQAIIKGLLLTQNAVVLLNFNRLPVTTLAPEASTIGPLPTEFQGIFKQTFELEFQADYFNTIELLERLEKVEGDLYWESLDYKVTNYPQANVTLKLYLLSRDKEQL